MSDGIAAKFAGKHCWHSSGGYTQGDGRAGDKVWLCCWCGKQVTIGWHIARDPSHGPYLLTVGGLRINDGQLPENCPGE